MASALLWPATNPTTSSLGTVVVTDPELAAVPVLEVPVSTSKGLAAATPANSWTSKLMVEAEAVCTVTVVVDLALASTTSPHRSCGRRRSSRSRSWSRCCPPCR